MRVHYCSLRTKFDINVNEPHVLKWMKYAMSKRFNGFRSALHKKLQAYATKEEALQNRPEEIEDLDDWIYLCDLFSSEKFQAPPQTYSKNRSKLRCNHCSGSKNFIQHKKEKAKQLGESVGPVQLFHDTRWSVEKRWVNEQARDLYEKMIEMLDETQTGESERTEAEICEEVLGKASSFNKNFAFCVTKQHDTSNVTKLRGIVEQQQNRIKDLEEQLILFDQQKEKIKLLEEQEEKLFEMLTHMTIATVHVQPATKPTRQPSPSPTADESSSFATTTSKASTSNV
ncbi:uncharacterized protein LOC116137104 isoform X1 [Pistacia vera]|uniref:uncharacterized protein LOC116137104 isoform X1 n=1 Tax=Pistacia vera TaxID=55513 RepID=UPI001262AD17|nr:uncharacterized protein LOC116137104 isoform X1 [Pistacia vera]